MNHEQRRAKGRTVNNEPTLTDQSQADDTNINVIIKKYGVAAATRGTLKPPEYLDHTILPQNLREAFEHAHRAKDLQQSLPEQLRNKTLDELTNLTAEQLREILAPPAPPPAAPTEEPPK